MSPHKFCYRISFTVQVNSTRGAVLILQDFGTKNTRYISNPIISQRFIIFSDTYLSCLYTFTHLWKKMLRRTLFSLKKKTINKKNIWYIITSHINQYPLVLHHKKHLKLKNKSSKRQHISLTTILRKKMICTNKCLMFTMVLFEDTDKNPLQLEEGHWGLQEGG